MRIMQLAHQYLPEYVGGVEFYTQWISRALQQRGHEVAIFYRLSAEGEGLRSRVEEGVRVWAAWSGMLTPVRRFWATFGDAALLRTFAQVLDETQPDVIHVEHLMGLPAALATLAQQRGIPFVITLWDFWWVCANAQLLTNDSQEICDGPRAYLNCARCAISRIERPGLWPALPALALPLAWRNRLLRQVMAAADRLIAPTPFVQNWYAEHGAPADTLVLREPALEVSAPSEARQKERQPSPPTGGREGGGAGAPLRFAYIGGLSWQKGLHVLLEAFSGVEGAAELWLAGDETFDPAYVSQLRALASPEVRFLGRLSRAQVWEALAQVDVVVVPTMWYETFSFIVSEAFIAGAPVIASRLGPVADRVRNGVDGLLVAPGDVRAWRAALQRLIDDRALLAELRGNVQAPLSLNMHVNQLEELYAELI